MNITSAAFGRFTTCPYLYKLHDVEGIPITPTTKQLVGRIVRNIISVALTDGVKPKDLPKLTAKEAGVQFAQDIAYTDEEVKKGQRNAQEKTAATAGKLLQVWSSAVAPRIAPEVKVNVPFSTEVGPHTLTGVIEIMEEGIRATRVRSRRPADGEAADDLGLILQAWVSPAVTVDYLINSDPLGVARQTVEVGTNLRYMVKERVNAMAEAVDAGVFTPTDPGGWKCKNCPLRKVCLYV